MTPIPSFFVVGAAKAGTTSIYNYLSQHPEIFMSPIKETGFFASELRADNCSLAWKRRMDANAELFRAYLESPTGVRRPPGVVEGWDQYLKLFRLAREGQAIGEVSAAYLWSRTAAQAIAERIPGARIIMILRNPAERLFSHYLQLVSEDRTRLSFAEMIRRMSIEYVSGGRTKSKNDRTFNPIQFGMYYHQVKRYMEQFADRQIGLFLYEEFCGDTAGTVRKALRLLGVREDAGIDVSRRYMAPKIPRLPFVERHVVRPLVRLLPDILPGAPRRVLNHARFLPRHRITMPEPDRRFLIDFYGEDILKLSGLIDRDLSHWLTCEPRA